MSHSATLERSMVRLSPIKPLGWVGIVRLGLVQAAIGAVVALTTSTLNRIMVVELALPAMLPAILVGIHFAVQISRPRWGYGSDVGGRRLPWIIGGMGVLCLGALVATDAALVMTGAPAIGLFLSVLAYVLIGLGVGAAGTSLLAFLSTRVAPERRSAAASITWTMMVVGIVISAGVTGKMIEPYSAQALAIAASCVAGVAFAVTLAALHRLDEQDQAAAIASAPVEAAAADAPPPHEDAQGFFASMREIWAEPLSRRFAMFVFLAMMAYSAQDLILEPFAGLVFGMTPGETSKLSSFQHQGVLLGMIVTGVFGSRSTPGSNGWMRHWTVLGCVGSAAGLLLLAYGGTVGPGFPLKPAIFFLGFANGVFAVSAIGSMMGLAGAGRAAREGTRMGLWGAAQALAFGLGGFLGAAGVDLMRALVPDDAAAFMAVFSAEALVFVLAAALAGRLDLQAIAAPGAGRASSAVPATAG
jgi:BCD family chlorophyll transporter-like MFS transporter